MQGNRPSCSQEPRDKKQPGPSHCEHGLPSDKSLPFAKICFASWPTRLACTPQVTSTRKGLRNQFKALLGLRKPGSLSPDSARPAAVNGTYDNSSPEGQLRHLGDLAFMLQVSESERSPELSSCCKSKGCCNDRHLSSPRLVFWSLGQGGVEPDALAAGGAHTPC